MDLIKIGKYIASKRKALGLTQVQLAEKLGKSDKSVSKWERGICLPDVSVYIELCQNAAQEGIAAIIPDFDQFKIRLIIAENGAKYSTEFDILENVPEREYYGRSATEITGRTRITENHEQDIVAFLYGRYGVRVPAIENIMEKETALSNDYTYKLSFQFGNGS